MTNPKLPASIEARLEEAAVKSAVKPIYSPKTIHSVTEAGFMRACEESHIDGFRAGAHFLAKLLAESPGEYPPRIERCQWPTAEGYYRCWIKCAPVTEVIEYLSLSEHQAARARDLLRIAELEEALEKISAGGDLVEGNHRLSRQDMIAFAREALRGEAGKNGSEKA